MLTTLNKINASRPSHKIEHNPRDPNEISKILKADFNSVIGEPADLKSPDWVWKASHYCYTYVHLWMYKLLTIIFSPFFAFIIAVQFALLSFLQIWIFFPINKYLHIVFGTIRKFVEIVSNGLFGPFLETLGLCLSNLKLRHQRVHDVKDEPQYPYII